MTSKSAYAKSIPLRMNPASPLHAAARPIQLPDHSARQVARGARGPARAERNGPSAAEANKPAEPRASR